MPWTSPSRSSLANGAEADVTCTIDGFAGLTRARVEARKKRDADGRERVVGTAGGGSNGWADAGVRRIEHVAIEQRRRPPVSTLTITIANNTGQPGQYRRGAGQPGDVREQRQPRSHEMFSDPHPEHTDCPEINQVGFLSPGQSRQTGNLNTVRTCGFHDHATPRESRCREPSRSSSHPLPLFPATGALPQLPLQRPAMEATMRKRASHRCRLRWRVTLIISAFCVPTCRCENGRSRTISCVAFVILLTARPGHARSLDRFASWCATLRTSSSPTPTWRSKRKGQPGRSWPRPTHRARRSS